MRNSRVRSYWSTRSSWIRHWPRARYSTYIVATERRAASRSASRASAPHCLAHTSRSDRLGGRAPRSILLTLLGCQRANAASSRPVSPASSRISRSRAASASLAARAGEAAGTCRSGWSIVGVVDRPLPHALERLDAEVERALCADSGADPDPVAAEVAEQQRVIDDPEVVARQSQVIGLVTGAATAPVRRPRRRRTGSSRTRAGCNARSARTRSAPA